MMMKLAISFSSFKFNDTGVVALKEHNAVPSSASSKIYYMLFRGDINGITLCISSIIQHHAVFIKMTV